MSSPSASEEPSSTCRHPNANPNRHRNFNEQQLQDIFLTVEQTVHLDEQNHHEEIRWDLSSDPQHFAIPRRANEGTRSVFDAPDVAVNTVEDTSSNLRLEPMPHLRSLRPRSRSVRPPSVEGDGSRNRRTPTTPSYRSHRQRRSYARSSSRNNATPEYRENRRRRENKRKRSPPSFDSDSSLDSCQGCDDPHCGKEYIVLTDAIKRCLMDHPVLGKGLFIRDPSMDAKALYVPGPGENYYYPRNVANPETRPSPYTYDINSTHAMFYPVDYERQQARRGGVEMNRRGRGVNRGQRNRRSGKRFRASYKRANQSM